MNTTDPPDLLKPIEVAVIIGQSVATVYRLIEAGTLPHVNVGTRQATRVRRTDLAAYLNTHAA